MTDSREDQYDDTADTEIEIETVAEDDSSDDDQFQKAEDATQKRINRLTKKMREAERQRDESIRYAQQVQTEAQTLKSRLTNLDTSYVNEYSTRVSTQIAQAEAALSRAIEMGDSKGTVEAQRTLTQLAIQADRADQARQQQERYSQQQAAQQQYQARQPMPAQQPRRPDAKAEQWALRNSWFGQDEAMTYALLAYTKSSSKTKGLTRRAMTTIMSLIDAFHRSS
jgi:predicted ribosome quality control (RQC) complex YloA/Tae2 family protein